MSDIDPSRAPALLRRLPMGSVPAAGHAELVEYLHQRSSLRQDAGALGALTAVATAAVVPSPVVLVIPLLLAALACGWKFARAVGRLRCEKQLSDVLPPGMDPGAALLEDELRQKVCEWNREVDVWNRKRLAWRSSFDEWRRLHEAAADGCRDWRPNELALLRRGIETNRKALAAERMTLSRQRRRILDLMERLQEKLPQDVDNWP